MDKQDLQEKLGYSFSDEKLLRNALTHSSYANENRDGHTENNERLEFLGDSILGFVSASYLFKKHRHLPEGELTKIRASLVCETALGDYATKIRLGDHLLLGRGEEHSGGRTRISILADATEAIIGAIFLDGGIDPAKKFIVENLLAPVEKKATDKGITDHKTMLQEIVQKNRQETLSYRMAGSEGPDHDKQFVVEVLLNSNVIGVGRGHSKKEAEQMAAKSALELMGV